MSRDMCTCNKVSHVIKGITITIRDAGGQYNTGPKCL